MSSGGDGNSNDDTTTPPTATTTTSTSTSSSVPMNTKRPQIAILDFGSQYSHLIARRVREIHVFCELYSCLVTLDELVQHHNIIGIILSGGPNSVYEENAPHVSKDIWDYIHTNQIPVLGICYGMQELAYVFDGNVEKGLKHEYGKAIVQRIESCTSILFDNIPSKEIQVWMSHGDKLNQLPTGFHTIASSTNSEYVAIENTTTKMYGIQFHPEVTHTPNGKEILYNFCIKIVKAQPTWIMKDYATEFIANVQKQVGPTGHVIGAVSGGVDSTVAAVLMTRAIGTRFHAILVNNGCLRLNESETVLQRLKDDCHVNLRCIDASERFLSLLQGVDDPEQKRKIIGNTFIHVFQEEAQRIEQEYNIKCEYLLQGTLYPDVIESISYKGPSATIKTHHNVGGLPSYMKLQLIEPLRELFKDEVRQLGYALNIDQTSIERHPFPGPGLAIRIIGEVTKERIQLLQHADSILIDELYKHNLYNSIGQAFVVLLPTIKSVGVMGDGRTYESVAAIRCVETTDYMTADFYHIPFPILSIISNRIINEVRGINRVCYDISSKPPATIEWE